MFASCALAVSVASKANGETVAVIAETARIPFARSRRERRSTMTSPIVGLALAFVLVFSASSNCTDSGNRDWLFIVRLPLARVTFLAILH